MAIAESFTGSATIGATEYSLPNNSTTLTAQTGDGWFQWWINFANMAGGDEYQIKVYEKVTSGGTQILAAPPVNLVGPQSSAYIVPAFGLLHGWDVTVKKIAGTDRSISWSSRSAA